MVPGPGEIEIYGKRFACIMHKWHDGSLYPTRIDWDNPLDIEEETMFTLSSTPKPGQCPARRCTVPPVPEDADKPNPYALCARHWNEWDSAGRPELKTGKDAPAPAPVASSALAVAPPATIEAEMETQRGIARQALDLCQQYKITSQADADMAEQIMGQIKRDRAAVEEKRTGITKPMNEALKRVNQLFKPVIEYYDSCEAALKKSVAGFFKAQSEAQYAALQAQAAELAAGAASAGAEVIAVAHGTENVKVPENLSLTNTYKVVSVDQTKLPLDYFIPDMRRIEREVRAGVSIPGVEVTKELQVINRA